MKALRDHRIGFDEVTLCGIDRLPFADIFGVPTACIAHDASWPAAARCGCCWNGCAIAAWASARW